MNPHLIDQMARDRRANLLREGEKYRHARLTARPRLAIRIIAKLPRVPAASRRSRALVVEPSTPGPMPHAREDQPFNEYALRIYRGGRSAAPAERAPEP